MKKKQKFSVLIISSAAKDSVKAKQLLDQKGVKYTGKAELNIEYKYYVWLMLTYKSHRIVSNNSNCKLLLFSCRTG